MKRPLSVTLIGCLFIVAGAAGIIYHARELTTIFTNAEVVLAMVVRLLAIVGGVFSLRGANWARWLLTSWIIYHVVLSFYHTPAELAIHVTIMIVVVVSLFHKQANAFFKKG